MKSQMLPVKRRPVSKALFRRLNAVTNSRRQRVAAAAASDADMETEDGSSKISRALTIIFLIHIVAIALIFIHQRFLDGREPAVSSVVKSAPKEAAPAISQSREDLPRLSSGDKPYIVRTGDNYARIAAAEGVNESDLRQVNGNVDIGPGLILKVPPKRIVAEDPPEVAAIRQQTPSDRERGLVEAVPVDITNAPRAMMVRPSVNHGRASTASGTSYVVQPGDSIFRIASRHKVSQQSLMRVNGISDPRKMRVGMKLAIPLQ